MTTQSPESTGQQKDKLFTVPDLASYLQVSTATVYRYVEQRLIAFISLPRGLRFKQAAVDDFVGRHSVACVHEHEYERT